MKNGILFFLFAFCLVGCTEEHEKFTVEVLNSYTPVKDQGKSELCWAYAMLSAIETEHIMRGDSVHLSVAWVDRMMEKDTLVESQRGMGMTLINMIERHGIVPYDAMQSRDDILPKFAFMLGEVYTPLEFAHSVCAPNEYIGLGSSGMNTYGEWFEPRSKDNWEHNQLLNIPMDSLLRVTERAVREHHGVCWEGDISEQGFDWEKGVARLRIMNGPTTDDHCMAIIGLARDGKGKPYFMMKNSWGTKNPYDGLMFMSYGYFKKKTIAVFLPSSLI